MVFHPFLSSISSTSYFWVVRSFSHCQSSLFKESQEYAPIQRIFLLSLTLNTACSSVGLESSVSQNYSAKQGGAPFFFPFCFFISGCIAGSLLTFSTKHKTGVSWKQGIWRKCLSPAAQRQGSHVNDSVNGFLHQPTANMHGWCRWGTFGGFILSCPSVLIFLQFTPNPPSQRTGMLQVWNYLGASRVPPRILRPPESQILQPSTRTTFLSSRCLTNSRPQMLTSVFQAQRAMITHVSDIPYYCIKYHWYAILKIN